MSNKRIMILGAGPFQVPAIKKAVSLGLHVITVDYLPDNIGHKFSHEYVNCSTTDREGVLKAARKMKIKGISTFSSDVAVPTVAHVSEHMGLPGTSFATAETMTYKHFFRAFQQKNALACPSFAVACSVEEAWNKVQSHSFPIISKPVDTSGSRGICKVSNCDQLEVTEAFSHAIKYSPLGTVCLEEFIDGLEVGGDGFLLDGKLIFMAITNKYMNGFVVAGHCIPASISHFDQIRVQKAIEDCCKALKYENGPFNFDVIVNSDQIFILEMSARNGGNGIPSVIKRAMGTDLEMMTIKHAVGDDPGTIITNPKHDAACSFIFGSQDEGLLKHINRVDIVRSEVPEVFELFLTKNPGDKVPVFTHNGNLLGYALFDCSQLEDYESITQRILQALDIEISKRDVR